MLAAVASMLFLPKLLAALVAGARDARAFGGLLRLVLSVVLEFVVSALLAPIRMLFHTQFVLAALAGWAIQWKSPKREDASTSFQEAIDRHGWQTLVGVAWVGVVAWQAPGFLPWIAPVAVGLLLAVPLSALMSRTSLGIGARAAGLFLTPDETRADTGGDRDEPVCGRSTSAAAVRRRGARSRPVPGGAPGSPTSFTDGSCPAPAPRRACLAVRSGRALAGRAAPAAGRCRGARDTVSRGSVGAGPSGLDVARREVARHDPRPCQGSGHASARSGHACSRLARRATGPRHGSALRGPLRSAPGRGRSRGGRGEAVVSAVVRRRVPARPAAACRPRTSGPRPSAIAAGGRRRRRGAAIRA